MTFGVKKCARDECFDIYIDLDTEREQKDISIRWGIPKSSTDWDDKKSMEFSKDRLSDLESYLDHEFGIKNGHTLIDDDMIWVYCYIFTVEEKK